MQTNHRMSWLQIYWPSPLNASATVALTERLVSDPSLGRVVIQANAKNGSVNFFMGVSPHKIPAFAQLLKDLVPGVYVVRVQACREKKASVNSVAKNIFPSLSRAISVTVRDYNNLLHTANHEYFIRSLLSCLTTVINDDSIVLQLVITARRPPSKMPYQSWWDVILNGRAPQTNRSSPSRQRHFYHTAKVHFRIGVHSSEPMSSREKIMSVIGALRSIETSHAQFRISPENPKKLAATAVGWQGVNYLSAEEIALLSAWPVGEDNIPGLTKLSPKRLPPPSWLPSVSQLPERAFANSNMPGQGQVRLTIPPKDSLLHTVLLGPTGVGKSTAMLNLILADINAGRGVLVIDPKADLVSDILTRIPAKRFDDVVIIDPTAPNPVGLNPLVGRLAHRNPELAADNLLSTFKSIFADSWGVRTEEVLTAALITLARAGQQMPQLATLVALPRLLTNSHFRRGVVNRMTSDPLGVGAFWSKYEAWSQSQQAQVIQPVLNKLQQFVIRPHMRSVLGQTVPKFELEELFSQRKIVLLQLNKGVLGAESVRLLGALLIGQLWPLILSRTSLPETRRTLTSVYIDEVHDFLCGIPGDLADALAQSRSLGVAFTMAHQYRAQLATNMRFALDANARNKIYFELSSADAKEIAASTRDLSPQDFSTLPRFHIYASLIHHGRRTGWVSGTTLPPPQPSGNELALRARSQEKYGTPTEQTEAALQRLMSEPFTKTEQPVEVPDPLSMSTVWHFGRSPDRRITQNQSHLNHTLNQSDDQPYDQS